MTGPALPSGIRFALEGIDEITFHKVLRDLMKDPAFARPLQIQAQPPKPPRSQQPGGTTDRPEEAGALTLVFGPEDRELALSAMQRLKTIMLRYGVQIDSVWTP
ncbi:hypothetical protein [Deinococcus altitudinis]|uniref:hypothetical protein n=1 Tax=Deinococcus altitudinis TaxID=468914 RepID=UPI003891B3CC